MVVLSSTEINKINEVVSEIAKTNKAYTITQLSATEINNIATAMEDLATLQFKFRSVNYLNYTNTRYLAYAVATASAFKQLLGNVTIQGMMPEVGNFIRVGEISPDAFISPSPPAGITFANWQYTAQASNSPELWIANGSGNFVLPNTPGQRYAMVWFGIMRLSANANITRFKIENFGKLSYNTWVYVEKLLRSEDIGIFNFQYPMFAMPGDPIKVARTDNSAGSVDEIAPFGLMFTENIASSRYNVQNSTNDSV
jgi:hypothetical protein